MTTREYPASLSKVKVDIEKFVFDKQEELWEASDYNYDVSFNWDYLKDKLSDISGYDISDFWYSRFTGGCYWSGILSEYPWSAIANRGYEEEDIWGLLLKYHINVNIDKRVITFKYNPVSPINSWLRYHTSDGDTPINVETVFTVAFKYVMQQYSENLWSYEEYSYCYKCNLQILPVYGKCPECRESHWDEEEWLEEQEELETEEA